MNRASSAFHSSAVGCPSRPGAAAAARRTPRLSDANMLNEIWEYGHTITSRMDKAIRMHSDDDPQVVEMTLTITADTDEFNEEFARFRKHLVPRLF